MELSKKVKALRKKQGLSQLELAEKIFVSRQAISGWEAGTSRPSTENLQCLSKLYPRKWTRDFDPWPRSADTHLTHRVRSAAPVL